MKSNITKFEMIYRILEDNSFDRSKLVPILQVVQKEYGYLPEEILDFIASSLDISYSKIYGVATFFTYFTLQPKGKHIIKICTGTACHVKKSTDIVNIIKNKLEIKNEEFSSKDNLFTIETVACLGTCGLAPVLIIDDNIQGKMTSDKAVNLVDAILKQERSK
ncbi:MAG: NAD(P)H-dependent oxidoreductase subunit E [Endomicrobium sp.]|jgi:NADH-quinone oxidoreductase subunit E|nr:NAD(P)H-dependent oxidoreductase subunit E [Endomicrobium sp.]